MESHELTQVLTSYGLEVSKLTIFFHKKGNSKADWNNFLSVVAESKTNNIPLIFQDSKLLERLLSILCEHIGFCVHDQLLATFLNTITQLGLHEETIRLMDIGLNFNWATREAIADCFNSIISKHPNVQNAGMKLLFNYFGNFEERVQKRMMIAYNQIPCNLTNETVHLILDWYKIIFETQYQDISVYLPPYGIFRFDFFNFDDQDQVQKVFDLCSVANTKLIRNGRFVLAIHFWERFGLFIGNSGVTMWERLKNFDFQSEFIRCWETLIRICDNLEFGKFQVTRVLHQFQKLVWIPWVQEIPRVDWLKELFEITKLAYTEWNEELTFVLWGQLGLDNVNERQEEIYSGLIDVSQSVICKRKIPYSAKLP